METYSRGQLAKTARLNREALRYYENSGLIPKAGREANGYRAYPSETLVLLDFYLHSQGGRFFPCGKSKNYFHICKVRPLTRPIWSIL